MGLGAEEIVNCFDSQFSEFIFLKDISYQHNLYKFLLDAMERREDRQQSMLESLPLKDSQFVGLCAES